MNQEFGVLHKRLVSSVMELLILQVIKERGFCGNEILKAINLKFKVGISSAKLYSTLDILKEKGWISGQRGGTPYNLTEKGQRIQGRLVHDYQNAARSIESILTRGFYIDAYRMIKSG